MNGDGKRLLLSIHSETGWTDLGADLRTVNPGDWPGMSPALRVIRFEAEILPADVPPLSASLLLLTPTVVAHFRPDCELALVSLPDGSAFLAVLPNDPVLAEKARAALAGLFGERAPVRKAPRSPVTGSPATGNPSPNEEGKRRHRSSTPKADPKSLTTTQARRTKSVEERIRKFQLSGRMG